MVWIPLFHAHLLYVTAENPLGGGDIPMPGPYEIECWTCTHPEVQPFTLHSKVGGPIHGANGSGAIFRVACNETEYFIIFAYLTAASTRQIWEGITSDRFWHDCNVPEGTSISGFAKFNLVGD